MPDLDVVTNKGGGAILIAKPKGFKWGPGELPPHFDHYLINTMRTPAELVGRCKITDGVLQEKPREEWAEVIDAKAQALEDAIDDLFEHRERFEFNEQGKISLKSAQAEPLEGGRL